MSNPKITIEVTKSNIEVEYVEGTDPSENKLAETIAETLRVMLEKATGSAAERTVETRVIH